MIKTTYVVAICVQEKIVDGIIIKYKTPELIWKPISEHKTSTRASMIAERILKKASK